MRFDEVRFLRKIIPLKNENLANKIVFLLWPWIGRVLTSCPVSIFCKQRILSPIRESRHWSIERKDVVVWGYNAWQHIFMGIHHPLLTAITSTKGVIVDLSWIFHRLLSKKQCKFVLKLLSLLHKQIQCLLQWDFCIGMLTTIWK